jgi:hypothetical protein
MYRLTPAASHTHLRMSVSVMTPMGFMQSASHQRLSLVHFSV